MTIDGAIIKEQGVTFGIVVVKLSAISFKAKAKQLRESIQNNILDFNSIPLVLAAQDAQGRFTYQGRKDIVNFLASIDSSRIPWRRYTVS